MSYVIEKNVPMIGRKSPEFYPWDQMEVGDSFLVPCSEEESVKVASRMSGVCSGRRQRHGQKYSVRKVDGGIRVWRSA